MYRSGSVNDCASSNVVRSHRWFSLSCLVPRTAECRRTIAIIITRCFLRLTGAACLRSGVTGVLAVDADDLAAVVVVTLGEMICMIGGTWICWWDKYIWSFNKLPVLVLDQVHNQSIKYFSTWSMCVDYVFHYIINFLNNWCYLFVTWLVSIVLDPWSIYFYNPLHLIPIHDAQKQKPLINFNSNINGIPIGWIITALSHMVIHPGEVFFR